MLLVCVALGVATPVAAVEFQVDHVIHISVDGLRGSVIGLLGEQDLPNFYRIQAEGAYTDNARTLREQTVTMPNHISMLTGRPRDGVAGHGVSRNSDPGNPNITVHTDKGSYVQSVFDVVHDNGLSTAFYAGWTGFNFIDNSWNASAGAPDLIGDDNGTDKIDTFVVRSNDDIQAQVTDLTTDLATDPYAYTLLHMHLTDARGHGFGWDSPQYQDAVRATDVQVGRILDFVINDPVLANNTAIVLTADHGGLGTGHGDVNGLETFRIPFYVWVSGQQIGQELYTANLETRADPGITAPEYTAPLQPIRNGDSGNLALDLLGLGPIPGSSINSQQDLRLQFDLDGVEEFFLLVDPSTGAARFRNQAGSSFDFEGYSITSASGSLVPELWHSLDDRDGPGNNDGGWRESNASSMQLAELLETGTFTMADGQSIDLEEILNPSSLRDLEFEVLLSGQSQATAMQVIYAPFLQEPQNINDFFVLVDPVTGDVQLRNQSGADISFDAYALLSISGSLLPAEWQSLDDLDGPGNDDGGWRESNASPQQLAELLQSGDFTLPDGQVIRLQNVFDAVSGTQDLRFEFLLPGAMDVATARVIYASMPQNPDFNGDGIVDAADYTVWRDSQGLLGIGLAADGDGNGIVDDADYQLWRANFGPVLTTSLDDSNAHAVPEPTSAILSFLFLVAIYRGRRSL